MTNDQEELIKAQGQIIELIEVLRLIRDKAWQFGRIDPAFGAIEALAENDLKIVRINDRPAPNPRPHGWRKRVRTTFPGDPPGH